MEKIIRVERNNIPVYMGYGKFSFLIDNYELKESLDQKDGEIHSTGFSKNYDEAWENVSWAWHNGYYDILEN